MTGPAGLPAGLLVVTDRRQARAPLAEVVDAAVAGGARWVLLREKDLPAADRAALAARLRAVLAPVGGTLTVAGPDPLGGSGVHLAAADPPAKADLSKAEQTILDLVNGAREKNRLPALTAHPTLMTVARDHTANMARQGKLAHTLDGKTADDRVRDSGYGAGVSGENIAYGVRLSPSGAFAGTGCRPSKPPPGTSLGPAPGGRPRPVSLRSDEARSGMLGRSSLRRDQTGLVRRDQTGLVRRDQTGFGQA